MRYDSQHKRRTRDRVVKEAAKALRRDGPEKLGVAAVMAKVGLTHGGFYAHFGSKDELIAEGVAQTFRDGRRRFLQAFAGRSIEAGWSEYIDFYLSPGHRDGRTSGCPLPFLSADAPRLPATARQSFAEGVAQMEDDFTEKLTLLGMPDPRASGAAIAAELVGTLSLARAEPDRRRADARLVAAKATLRRRLGLPDSGPNSEAGER